MYVLANAFSIGMIDNDATISFHRASLNEVKEKLSNNNFKSIVGHQTTAEFLSELIGVEVQVNREMYKLKKDDILIVAQLKQRLPEGKVLSKEEVEEMYNKGFVEFWEVKIIR